MSSIQSALAAIDSFVWGPPLLILLVGTGIYLTLRLGLLQVVRLPLALKLVFGRDQGQGKQGTSPASPPSVLRFQPLSALATSSGSPPPSSSVAPAPCSGCGWRRCLAWPPSTPSACWRSNTASRMPTVRWLAAPCTIWRRAWLQAARQAVRPIRHRRRLLRHRYLPPGQRHLRRHEPLLLGAP